MDFDGDGPWDVPIEGFQVMHMTIGAYLVDLFAYGDGGVTGQIRLEEPFEFRDPDGRVCVLDPGEVWEPLAALFVLRQVDVRLARFTKNGELHVEFETGHTIGCSTDGPYEAWELHAPGGIMVIGRAGEPVILSEDGSATA